MRRRRSDGLVAEEQRAQGRASLRGAPVHLRVTSGSDGAACRFVRRSSASYYYATADGDPGTIATLIAKDLHEKWWKDEAFAQTREIFKGRVKGPESALKAEVARYVAGSLERLSDDPLHVEELDMLRRVVIDGVITTNFDPLMEHVFPTFGVFVGQDELLFGDAYGVGEIYKIHGSHQDPDSIVLTSADYERFGERNPYLAAKLLTIFVEHPVVLLGYSLSDLNVTTILRSIVAALTRERIGELQDRLLFVEWDPDAGDEPRITGTAILVDGASIPVLTVKVRDFREVFVALGGLKRKLPARILRQLKEQVYELVRTNDPQGRLYVQDLTADVDASQVDVVFGAGAIEKVTASYRGKSRDDLIDDVLGDGDLDPARVVDEVLPPLRRDMHFPIFKYMRGAGYLTATGLWLTGRPLMNASPGVSEPGSERSDPPRRIAPALRRPPTRPATSRRSRRITILMTC